jgi:mutator protein MutT
MRGKDKKPYFHVTAGVIWKNGRVLIAKRPKGSHLEGLWEFPGGKQERGESLKDCLEREIEEELGLKVKVDKALLTVNHEYEAKGITLHVFSCIPLAGEPEALGCQQIKWVDPFDLKGFSFPPPDIEVIEYLINCRNGIEGEVLGVL